MKEENIIRIINDYPKSKTSLIPILEDIQIEFNYLPANALKKVSEALTIPLIDIYGVATFFKTFSLSPRGRHIISICSGTACHVLGANLLAHEFERKLNIKAGETTKDGLFTLETVNCLGACAIGPIVVVDGKFYSQVKIKSIDKILNKYRDIAKYKDIVDKDDSVFRVDVSCPYCNHNLMDSNHMISKCPSIRLIVSYSNKLGWLRISGLYGDPAIASEHDIPDEQICNFFCHHCNSKFRTTRKCPLCRAPMINMKVIGGGNLQICSRRGCSNHQLELH